MRLDLFLKATRLVLRRTVAQEMCEAGVVSVNGAAAKSSRAVNIGDEITLRRRNKLLAIRVLSLPAARQTSRAESSTLYQILHETNVDEES